MGAHNVLFLFLGGYILQFIKLYLHVLWTFLSYSTIFKKLKKHMERGFPGGAVVESPPAIAGDTGSSPGLGRSHMPRSN